MITLHKITNF